MKTRAPRWTTILAVLLVPLLVAGGFLWGTWDANPRLRNVKAAVVNNDEMVTVNGQVMPLGRQLAAELVDSGRDQNLTWVLADDKHAQAGLADGTYAAVVTIPKEFSAAATSFSGDASTAKQATIHVQTSQLTGVTETALGQHIADAAATALNKFLTTEYLKNIYLGFNEMSDQFKQLKDGTAQLADGAQQLSDGLAQAAAGGGQLETGAASAAAGAQQLATGTDTYIAGVATFSDGVHTYTAGVAQYVGAVNPIVTQVRSLVVKIPDWGDLVTVIDPIMTQLPTYATDINTRTAAFVEQFKQLLAQVDAMADDATTVKALIQSYADKATSTPIPCPAALADIQGACDAFEQGVQQAQQQAAAQWQALQAEAAPYLDEANVDAWVDKLSQAADELLEASQKFVDWVPDAQAQWAALKAQLPNGTLTKADVLSLLDQFIDGGNQLVTGGTQLADGSDQLLAGGQQLATGTHQFSSGLQQLSAGISLYVDGVGQAADGAAQLADGTRKLADGVASGAGQIPTYTDAQRQNLATVVASPIDTTGLDELVLPTISWASLLLAMALWLGAMAAYSVFRAVDPEALTSSDSNLRLLGRRLAPGLAVVATQALGLTVVGAVVLRMSPAAALGLGGVALVAALAFASLNQALVAWFGNRGRVVAFALLLVAVIAALAYSAPEVFGALAGLSPLTPALAGVRAVMTGQSAVLPVLGLGAWALLGLAATWAAVQRARTVPLALVAA